MRHNEYTCSIPEGMFKRTVYTKTAGAHIEVFSSYNEKELHRIMFP